MDQNPAPAPAPAPQGSDGGNATNTVLTILLVVIVAFVVWYIMANRGAEPPVEDQDIIDLNIGDGGNGESGGTDTQNGGTY